MRKPKTKKGGNEEDDKEDNVEDNEYLIDGEESDEGGIEELNVLMKVICMVEMMVLLVKVMITRTK